MMTISWDGFFSERTEGMKGSEIREFFKLTEQPEVISFAGGFPCPKCFPREELARALGELVIKEGASALQYGPTEGNYQLRLYLAQKMNRVGVNTELDNIIITNGSQQGLDLIGKVLLDPHDLVIAEEPGYVGGLGAITNYQGEILSIPVDEEGLCTELLEEKLSNMSDVSRIKFAYVVPSFQNPTGVSMSLRRRRHLLELAGRYDFLVIEDNPYGELIYEGESSPTIKSLDTEGRVLYLGSFSKVFIPGIRVGWIVGERPLIEKMIAAKQATDLCSNTLGQHLVFHFSATGFLDNHVEGLVSYYHKKRDLMLSSMEKCFPKEVSWTRPAGGFFIWVTFPSYLNSKDMLLKSLDKKKVAYVDGAGFFVNGSGGSTARFSYSEASPEEICEGISRLGDLLLEEVAAQKEVGEGSYAERPLSRSFR